MTSRIYRSWGLVPDIAQTAHVLNDSLCREDLDKIATQSYLPFGCGSSYGDVCLNSRGVLLDSQKLDRFLAFNETTGTLRCQSGVTLRAINRIFVQRGWFLPVTPGTQNVTIGGAIANDVHGKNHHQAGSFGCHVKRLGLYRSQDGNIECSPEENPELFKATIAGLGLTGFIQWAEIQLKPVAGAYLQTEKLNFKDLATFETLSNKFDKKYEYTVAWLDSVASGKKIGRGVYFCGNHSGDITDKKTEGKPTISIPFNAPDSLLSKPIVALFNQLYYSAHKLSSKKKVLAYYEPFFYPLDSLAHWNRLYGRKGFYQYQCVVPAAGGIELIQELLTICTHYGTGSFLSVLKKFGDIKSPGMLSFPRPGYTLALDFRNQGRKTQKLFAEMDKVVFEHQGALYPAKDARMSHSDFRMSFPGCDDFMKFIDPMFSSDFLDRVMLGESQ